MAYTHVTMHSYTRIRHGVQRARDASRRGPHCEKKPDTLMPHGKPAHPGRDPGEREPADPLSDESIHTGKSVMDGAHRPTLQRVIPGRRTGGMGGGEGAGGHRCASNVSL
jgi:hypothetical protein